MLTTGSKWFFGLGAVSFVLAAAYGWSTGGDRLGPVTAGYWGAVGDHLGYTLLVSTGVAATFLGVTSLMSRDANPSALAELAGTDEAPPAVAPAHSAYWPVIGAFGATLVVLGLAISNVMFMVGCFVLLGVLVEWMVLAWSDRATGDPEVNHAIRRRIMAPFEVPLLGFLIVAGTVLAFSRLLLTSSSLGAVVVATFLAVAILTIGILLAMRPQLSPSIVAGILSLAALAVITSGVVAASRGERTIEPHSEEHSEGEGEAEGTGLAPYTPEGTNAATTTTVVEGEG
jgi:hypothetical protein